MTDDSNKVATRAEEPPGFDSDDVSERGPAPPRREPVFTGFDDEQEYEEPERDTDYASRYIDDQLDDHDMQADELEFDWDDGDGQPDAPAAIGDARDTTRNETIRQPEDDELDIGVSDEESPPWEEEYEDDYAEEESKWPVGLVAVGLVAVILLAAGGYGVLQQRAATEEEIRQLRAQLATASQPAAAPVDNTALAEARKRNVELSVAMESLSLENRRLQDTVAGLEAQLEAQQEALARPASGKPTKPTPTKPAATAPAATPAGTPEAASSGGNTTPAGDWFVNFGSYTQRATADKWATKIQPASGRSVVTTGSRDGKTFYRVRVIDLADKAAAEGVARQLESEYGLSKLWVGR
jgi:cell division septation protein DedD